MSKWYDYQAILHWTLYSWLIFDHNAGLFFIRLAEIDHLVPDVFVGT
jgi:hypothetical protein